jgi:hypothetical protein
LLASIEILNFYTQVTIVVIGLRLDPWVIFTPDMRAWFGLNPPMGKGGTMREASQLGGKKLYIDAPEHPGVSLALIAV